MARKIVSVSLEPEFEKALQALAEQMNFNMSQTIRYILRRAIDQPRIQAALIEEVNGVQYRLRKRAVFLRSEFQRLLTEQVEDLFAPYMLEELQDEREAAEREYVPPVDEGGTPPALPARGEDIVEGEIETEGLSGRRRRRRR